MLQDTPVNTFSPDSNFKQLQLFTPLLQVQQQLGAVLLCPRRLFRWRYLRLSRGLGLCFLESPSFCEIDIRCLKIQHLCLVLKTFVNGASSEVSDLYHVPAPESFAFALPCLGRMLSRSDENGVVLAQITPAVRETGTEPPPAQPRCSCSA